jgi:hypothetical protein
VKHRKNEAVRRAGIFVGYQSGKDVLVYLPTTRRVLRRHRRHVIFHQHHRGIDDTPYDSFLSTPTETEREGARDGINAAKDTPNIESAATSHEAIEAIPSETPTSNENLSDNEFAYHDYEDVLCMLSSNSQPCNS